MNGCQKVARGRHQAGQRARPRIQPQSGKDDEQKEAQRDGRCQGPIHPQNVRVGGQRQKHGGQRGLNHQVEDPSHGRQILVEPDGPPYGQKHQQFVNHERCQTDRRSEPPVRRDAIRQDQHSKKTDEPEQPQKGKDADDAQSLAAQLGLPECIRLDLGKAHRP